MHPFVGGVLGEEVVGGFGDVRTARRMKAAHGSRLVLDSEHLIAHVDATVGGYLARFETDIQTDNPVPVSYTHLTLPTSDLV